MQMPVPPDQHVIEAFSPDTAQESFADCVRFGGTIGRLENLNRASPHRSRKGRATQSVALAIAHQKARRFAVGCGFGLVSALVIPHWLFAAMSAGGANNPLPLPMRLPSPIKPRRELASPSQRPCWAYNANTRHVECRALLFWRDEGLLSHLRWHLIYDDALVRVEFLGLDLVFGQKDFGVAVTVVARCILRRLALNVVRRCGSPTRHGVRR